MELDELKISQSEYYINSIARLGNEPNAKNEYGLKRMTARELKEYLMRPSLLFYEKFNNLVNILSGLDENDEITEDSILGLIHTGIPSIPTLYDLVVAIRDADGDLLDYISAGDGQTLRELIDSKQDTLVSGTNIKTINHQSLLGSGNINIPGGDIAELYECTYGTTTFAQITQALADDKLPYVIFPTGEYFYYYKNIDNLKYRFTESYIRETGITYFIDVDTSNNWGIVPVNLEVTSNKVTSWGNPTSDSKYPSEKLVKDSLNKLDNIFIIDNGDTTKYAELVQAHNDGKVLICRGTASTYDEGKFYILYEWDDVNEYARFAMVDEAPWILIAETSLSNPLVWDNRVVALQEQLKSFGADQNIKTINNTSLLGSGDISISGGTSYLLDLDTYAYESNVYTITGIDLTNATKVTLLPDATQNTLWFYEQIPVSVPHITAITASSFHIEDIGSTPAGRKLILTVYS